MIMTAGSVSAQGLGFYLGGKRVELAEGDSVNFTANSEGEVEVKVTQDGEVQVYKGEEMTFFGDVERYFMDVNNAMHYYDERLGMHCAFGYGAIMHVRDILTADMYRPSTGYNWFRGWATNRVGPNSAGAQMVWNFYEQAIAATNNLIGAIDESKASDRQKEYLGVAYAFRAMHYLDMARMYEYLPNLDTKPYSHTGRDITHLTVPIITEKTTPSQVAQLTRATREEMRAFIEADLDKAATYLAHYRRTSKLLPDLACVYGLQARLSMWVEDYPKAAQLARKAIGQSGATPLTEAEMLDVENGFNSLEPSSWMWGAQPREDDRVVTTGLCNWTSWMSNEQTFGYASFVPLCITPSLVSKMIADDPREKLFKTGPGETVPHLSGIDWDQLPLYASLKFRPYKGCTDNSAIASQSAYPLMRVEEMYFIEAEAKAHSSVSEGMALLDAFLRKYKPGYTSVEGVDAQHAIQIIVAQKRIELWGEGQSFFDYKRLDMGVDRTQNVDVQYIPEDQQFYSIGRPAWMNLSFPNRSNMMYPWNTIGQENPDPSGIYKPGGGTVGFGESYYSVRFNDGIVRELFGLSTPSEYITLRACAMDTAQGIVLQEPFAQVADSTMGYDGSPLSIRLNGTEASIPAQPLGFKVNGNSVTVQSTRNGTFTNGVITFPCNSITLTYGSEVKVVNSQVLTEVRLPDSPQPGISIGSIFGLFYAGPYQATVVMKNGKQYLHARVWLSELDELRVACVPPSEADNAMEKLKADSGYGAVAKDTGWVNIPMMDIDGEFTLVAVGMRNGSVFNTYQSYPVKYPDYEGSIHSGQKDEDQDGNTVVKALCYFGPHVEKGYVALVEKYANADEVKQMYEAGTLPSVVQVPLDHTSYYQVVTIPFPKRYAQYKLMSICVAGGKVVSVNNCGENMTKPEQVFEYPERALSATLTGGYRDSTGTFFFRARYDLSDFESAYIALLPDSMLTGNVWEAVYNTRAKTKVTSTSQEREFAVGKIDVNARYTLVIAGCDTDGKIVKDVQYPQAELPLWSPLYTTKQQWVQDGNAAGEWPLADSTSTCSYTYKNLWSGTDAGLTIGYRKSYGSSQGQFIIKNWGSGTNLTIDYDPETSLCQVKKQWVTEHSEYGDVWVSDVPHYESSAGYDGYPCTYDRKTGTFNLTLIYYVEEGYFGYETETVQVDGFSSEVKAEVIQPAKKAAMPQARAGLTLKNIPITPAKKGLREATR